MAIVTTDNKHYKAIADKVREIKGTTETMTPSEMPSKVQSVYDTGYEKGKAEGGDTEQAFEDGKQAERDNFWEMYQNGGAPQNYNWAFAYDRFSDEAYNPKYPITCVASNISSLGAQSIFRDSRMLTDTKVEIFSNGNSMLGCFNQCYELQTIRKIHVTETVDFPSAFASCTALENIEFDGTIGKSIQFAQSKILSAESVQNIIDHLMTITDGVARTVAFHADVKAKLTDEQKATITTTKGWTLA